jgi:NADH:ubiquinone oxidoreductase subunit 5 (subunit L)/multisubunit Na+/H+ antiporter MnhA subunit
MNGVSGVIAIVFVPILLSFFLPFIGRASERLRNAIALIAVLLPLGIASFMAPGVFSGASVSVTRLFPLGFNFILEADKLAIFMAIVSSFLSAAIVLYSFGYIRHYGNRNEYFMMVVFFLGSMMGLIFSANLIFLYIFWEMTALASWRLIGFYRGEKDVYRANKAFLVTVFGALLMLIGFLVIFKETGSFDLSVIKEAFKTRPVPVAAVFLILAGIFAKSATLPFHTWLPDAGVAPSPVTALLHAAILVKIGVYVYARLFVATMPILENERFIILFIVGLSALVSGGAALIEKDIKRIIAYSTVSQLGFIFLGLASGNPIGIAGGILYILMHGAAKAGLFLSAGIVEQNLHEKDITRMGGLARTMPVTAVSFLLCAFSVMGIPPFGGFFSKYMVILGGIDTGYKVIAGMFLFGAVLTVLYLIRVFSMVFMGEPKKDAPREGSFSMVFSVALLAAVSLAGGIFIWYPNLAVFSVVSQMMGK